MATAGFELLERLLPRADLLACLEDSPMTKPELTEACGVSRSTVNRGINSLEAAGVVERVEGSRYGLTLFGSIVSRELEHVGTRLHKLNKVADLITEVGHATDLQAELFDDATIRPPEGMGITAAIDAFKGAHSLRIVDPPFGIVYMLVAADPDILGEMETEILVREEMVAEISAIDSIVADAPPGSSVELRRTGEELPFSVALADHGGQTVLYLVLQNRHGGIAVVRTESPKSVAWGEDLYERLARGAVELAPAAE
jgi:biotin operon repressor